MKLNSTTTMIGLAVLILALLLGGVFFKQAGPSKYDSFAQCITDNGGKLYTASWCPHCERQLAMFGSSKRNLDNKECALADGTNNISLCESDGITTVPTWELADGSRFTGTTSLEDLADTFGCELPE